MRAITELTEAGRNQAVILLIDVAMSWTDAESDSMPEPVREPTEADLARALFAYGAMKLEKQTQHWFREQCMDILRALGSEEFDHARHGG